MNRPVYIHLSEMPESFVDGEGICIGYSRGSQWFGFPVMPSDYPLPVVNVAGRDELMRFICQIDCREIPEEVPDLPHGGMLYFFAELGYYGGFGGDILPMYAGKDHVRAVYIPEEGLTELAVRDDEGFGRVYAPEKITLSFVRPTGEEADHQLLGEPEHREWEDWDEPYEGWRLLFQMDSCDGRYYHYNFQDWGVFNVLISPEALRNRDFSDVRGIILST